MYLFHCVPGTRHEVDACAIYSAARVPTKLQTQLAMMSIDQISRYPKAISFFYGTFQPYPRVGMGVVAKNNVYLLGNISYTVKKYLILNPSTCAQNVGVCYDHPPLSSLIVRNMMGSSQNIDARCTKGDNAVVREGGGGDEKYPPNTGDHS